MARIEAESEHHLRGTWVRRLGMSLDEIAIHEAAHATIAWVTGRGVLGVSMVTDAQFRMLGRHPRRGTPLGRTDFPPLPALSLDDRRYRLLAEREAMIGLSGDLAVRKLRGTPL